MSTSIIMGLKRRAKMLAAGVALSAATFAMLPGVAEATGGCINPCLNGGGAGNTSGAGSVTVGQVALADGVNSNANLNTSPNTAVASQDFAQQSGTQQAIRPASTTGFDGGGTFAANQSGAGSVTVGQVALADGVDSNANLNASPNTAVASQDFSQNSGTQQAIEPSGTTNGDGGFASNQSGEGSITVGQVAAGDVADLNTNVNTSPNIAVLSQDFSQESGNQQGINTGSSKGTADESGSAGNQSGEDSITAGQVAVNDVVDLNTNADVSPNTAVASQNFEQGSNSEQGINTGSDKGNTDSGSATNQSGDGSITAGQLALTDGVDSNANLNTSPNIAVLSQDFEQNSGNEQTIGSSNAGSSNEGVCAANESGAGSITVGQTALNDVVDVNTNANTSPNIAVLSRDFSQNSGTQQGISTGGDNNTGGDQQGCNSGNGNGSEDCDPGNSALQNKGGDEVPGNSTPNPGGNNVD